MSSIERGSAKFIFRFRFVPAAADRGPKHGRSEPDRCVLCGASTEFLVSDPVEMRQHYVDGAGQLCRGCGLRLGQPNQ